jgi:glyoxylase-like metal-dependent hydrolase (beta-lactamase superfamily II)
MNHTADTTADTNADTTADITAFFDAGTGSVTHVIADPASGAAAIIDPVLDFDARSARIGTRNAEQVLAHVQARRLKVQWILETHAHADRLSAAAWLKQRCGGRIAVGEHIVEVQATWKRLYHLGDEFVADGRDFDHLLAADETFHIGGLAVQAWWLPGHTRGCVAYVVGDDVFIGDTLFMPDVGSARCDFPGGDARALYRSVRRLLALPPLTRLHLCHDDPPGAPPARAQCWVSTVAEQRAGNIHVHDGMAEDSFVAMREKRDATLGVPALILPALQVNIRAGRLPAAEGNGIAYLKLPLDTVGRASA